MIQEPSTCNVIFLQIFFFIVFFYKLVLCPPVAPSNKSLSLFPLLVQHSYVVLNYSVAL